MRILILIVIGIVAISVTACDTVTKKKLPIEVVELKEANKMDTLLIIKTNEVNYLFDKNEKYIGGYDVKDDYPVVSLFLFFLFLFIGVFIGYDLND